MTAPEPSPDRDELLARVLAGEIAPDAPEVRRAMAADPSFASELHSLARLVDELDETGAMTAGTATGEPEPWPGADDKVRQQVRGALQRPDAARASLARADEGARRRLPQWRLAMAAAVIAVVVGWRVFGGSELPVAPPDERLGRQLLPTGTITRDELRRDGFRWADRENPTTIGRFQVVVRDANHAEILKSPDLGTAERWLLTREQVDSLPAQIKWTVTLRLGGEPMTWTADLTLR